MRTNINVLIYGYLIVCVLLVLFNLFYIFYSSAMKRLIEADAKRWESEIRAELFRAGGISEGHLRRLRKRTRVTNGLLAYSRAVEALLRSDEEAREGLDLYLRSCALEYQNIALAYAERDSMDRAFAAYFIARTTPSFAREHRPIFEIFSSYIENSSVYCRENVLKAFYAFGNVQALYNFLILLEERGLSHNRKLLTDGLISFRGDKEALAELLWENRAQFSENTLLSVIGFLTSVRTDFSERIYDELLSGQSPLEVEIAYLRYYRKHIYEPIVPVLYTFLEHDINPSVNIVVANVLSSYPGERTTEVLKKALGSGNWYVRLNSANSLLDQHISEEEIRSILENGDRYAREMMRYTLEEREAAQYA